MEKASQLAGKAKQSIEKFVDTVKLKAHLGSMETKETWEKVAKQVDFIKEDLEDFTTKISQEKDEAKLQGHLALMNAKERWENLIDDMDSLTSHISQKTEAKYDHAKVQLHLAKLEMKELVDKAQVQKHFHDLGDEVKEDWYTILSKIDQRVIDFINRFPLK